MPFPRRTFAALTATSTLALAGAGATAAHAAVVVDRPVAGGFVNNHKPTIVFHDAVPNAKVDLLGEGRAIIGTTTADAEGDGTVTATTRVDLGEDQIGNQAALIVNDGTEDTVVNFRLDQTPAVGGPGGSVPVAPAELDFTIIDAIPNEPVVLLVDGEADTTATADADGVVDAIGPTAAVAPGEHTFAFVTVDDYGDRSTPSEARTIAVMPPAPSFAGDYNGSYRNTGVAAFDVDDVDPLATKVTLYASTDDPDVESGFAPVATTTPADGKGTLTTTLLEGSTTLYVTQTVNGVESDNGSSYVTLEVRTGAPVLGTPDVGEFGTSFRVNDALCSFGEDTAVRLYVDDVLVDTTNPYECAADLYVFAGEVAPGAHTAYATTVDSLGHEGPRSNEQAFTIAQPPAVEEEPTGPQSGNAPVVTPPVVTPPVTTPPAVTPPAPVTPAAPAKPAKVKASASTLTARKPVKISFTVARPATVKVTYSRIKGGKAKKVASSSVKVKRAGKASFTVKTKVGKTKLAKGKYSITLRVVTADGQSKPVTIKLTVK